jgi:hypothetical protein
MMNCYAGLAKRLAKSCFQEVKPNRVIPVPQLQPLDARNIIKREVQLISTNNACFALSDAHERVNKPKPISDEDAWALAVVWAEAKAQEREAAATKEESQTNTDESYDSDEFADAPSPSLAAIAICPVQVRVEPKKQRPLTYQEELLVRTHEEARAVCRFDDKDEVGVPTHSVVRNCKPVFADKEFVDDDKIPWAVLTKKSVSLFENDSGYDFTENPPPSHASATPASDTSLLEGWEVRRSRRNGRVWYFHAATKKKTWTRPVTETKVPSEEDKFDSMLAQLVALRARMTELEFVDADARVKAAKEARRAWNVANDPSTWYRV